MPVQRTDTGELESVLTVSVSRETYEPQLKKELQKYREKAQMKGFRKGKVPMSMVKKLYGKSVLVEVVNEMVQSELNQFFVDEKLSTLGQPIPSDDQKNLNFDLKELTDFEFSFDVGRAPEIQLQGLDKADTYTKWIIQVPEDMVEQELESLRRRAGKQIHPEDSIEKDDVITFNARELEGEVLKPKGYETSFQIPVNMIADDSIVDELLKGKKDSVVRFNIFALEKDRDETFVRKHMLKMEEGDEDLEVGQHFEGTVVEVSRIEPAEYDQEFFDQAFGGEEVSSEDQARTKVSEWIGAGFNRQSEALLYREFQDQLMDKNDISLPEDFLKRWLVFANDNVDRKTVESEFDSFARGLRWNLIEGQIKKEHELVVEQDEVREVLEGQIRQYMGGYPMSEEMMDGMVNRLMGDEQQFTKAYEEKMGDKVFEKITELVTVKDATISKEEFEEKMEEARQTMQTPDSEEE